MYKVIYPFNGWVDEKRILVWYQDAVANCECDDFDGDTIPIEFAIEQLMDSGKFTFSKEIYNGEIY
jgi:hypothetical protein